MAWNSTTLSASPSSLDIDGSNKFTVSVAYSIAVNHLTNVQVSVAGQTYSIGTVNGSSFTWTPPVALLNAIPRSSSATVTISGQPTDGNGTNWGGRESCTCTVKVPSGYIPSTPASLTLTRIDNGVPPAWGVYVQGKSKISIAWGASNGTGGASVKSYTVRIDYATGGYSAWSVTDGTTYTPSSTFTAGTHTVTVSAVDSRDRVSGVCSATFTVLPYQIPGVAGYRCERTDGQGNSNTLGQYIKAWLDFQCADVGGNNSATATVAYRVSGSGNYSAETNLPQQTDLIFGGSFDPNIAYDVRFTITDALGTVTTYIAKVKALSIALEFLSGGEGAAFGKAATNAGELDVNWNLRVRGNLSVAGTQSVPATQVSGWASLASSTIPYAKLSGAPSLAAVATSGSYTDLSNKPSIPTQNNLVTGDGYFTLDISYASDYGGSALFTMKVGSAVWRKIYFGATGCYYSKDGSSTPVQL
jgi:hypothetical protein